MTKNLQITHHFRAKISKQQILILKSNINPNFYYSYKLSQVSSISKMTSIQFISNDTRNKKKYSF